MEHVPHGGESAARPWHSKSPEMRSYDERDVAFGDSRFVGPNRFLGFCLVSGILLTGSRGWLIFDGIPTVEY